MGFHPSARARLLRWSSLFVVLAAIVAGVVWWRDSQVAKKPQPFTSTSSSSVPEAPASFNKSQYSINDPASIWVVVNKGRILPADYVPAKLADNMQLRSETATALENLVSGAAKEGLKIILVSGYRSYATQKSVYASYSSAQGQAAADTFSARAGHSEHQTGLAADVGSSSGKCQLDKCLGDTSEGKWLAANAYKYGFIIRYQKDKQDVTGYDYEPWHIRFVGTALAIEINKTGQALEQFFGLATYTDYPLKAYELKSGT